MTNIRAPLSGETATISYDWIVLTLVLLGTALAVMLRDAPPGLLDRDDLHGITVERAGAVFTHHSDLPRCTFGD